MTDLSIVGKHVDVGSGRLATHELITANDGYQLVFRVCDDEIHSAKSSGAWPGEEPRNRTVPIR